MAAEVARITGRQDIGEEAITGNPPKIYIIVPSCTKYPCTSKLPMYKMRLWRELVFIAFYIIFFILIIDFSFILL